MGTSLYIQDLDKVYHEQLHLTPALLDYNQLMNHEFFAKAISSTHRNALIAAQAPQNVNTMRDASIEDKERINNSIYTRYVSANSTQVLEDIPACLCGHFDTYKNLNCICPKCNEPVLSSRTNDLHSLVWIAAPKGIPAFINPTVYRILADRFKVGPFDVLRWLLDHSYTSPGKTPIAVSQLEHMQIPRGIIAFYEHFDHIFNTLINLRSLKRTGAARQRDDELVEFIARNRGKIFARQLPAPNKMLLVIESNNFATYMDPKLAGIIDAIWLMVGIDSEYSSLNLRQKEIRVAKAMAQIADFHRDSDNTTLSQKEGIFRRQVYGMRAWGSWRTVVSSITDPHNYRDIYIPWHVGVTIFHYHLVNKLSKRVNEATGRRFTPHEIDTFIDGHVNKWHPLMRELFDEILAETPDGRGYPALMNRNPSLYRNSIQAVWVTKIKDDVTDVTTSLSILSVRPMNCDFDGDAKLMACTVVILIRVPL